MLFFRNQLFCPSPAGGAPPRRRFQVQRGASKLSGLRVQRAPEGLGLDSFGDSVLHEKRFDGYNSIYDKSDITRCNINRMVDTVLFLRLQADIHAFLYCIKTYLYN